MHTPGHTVEHTCFVVNSEGKTLGVAGDPVSSSCQRLNALFEALGTHRTRDVIA
jgi:glyoxylase-like metal-dependent hydrolase (beta-lactamase superfamily II)